MASHLAHPGIWILADHIGCHRREREQGASLLGSLKNRDLVPSCKSSGYEDSASPDRSSFAPTTHLDLLGTWTLSRLGSGSENIVFRAIDNPFRQPSSKNVLGLKGLTQDTGTTPRSTWEYRICHLISSVQSRLSALSYSTTTHDGSSHEMCMACVVLNVRNSFRITIVHVNSSYQGASPS